MRRSLRFSSSPPPSATGRSRSACRANCAVLTKRPWSALRLECWVATSIPTSSIGQRCSCTKRRPAWCLSSKQDCSWGGSGAKVISSGRSWLTHHLVFLTARVLSATAGVASVWVLFRVARHLFDERTALIAASFLALAFLPVRDSHFGVPDTTATFFVLVSFLFIVRFWESSQRRDLIVAAVAAGLATSTKYNAAIISLAALWVVFRPRSGSDDSGGGTQTLGALCSDCGFHIWTDLAILLRRVRAVDRLPARNLGTSRGRAWCDARTRLGGASHLVSALWTRASAPCRRADRPLHARLETPGQGNDRGRVSGGLLGPHRQRLHGVRTLHPAGGTLFCA